MHISEFQTALELPEISPYCRELFDALLPQLPSLSQALLEEESLCRILEEFHIFPAYREEVLEAAREAKNDPVLALYLCMLQRAMEQKRIYEFPVKTVPGSHTASRFGLALPLLKNIPNNAAYLRSRGITEEMLRGTFYEFDRAIEVYSGRAGGEHRFPVSSFWWMQLVYENRLVRLGRLNMEMRNFIGNVKVFRNTAGELKLLAQDISIHKSGRPLGAALCKDEDGAIPAAVTETEDAYIGYPADSLGLFKREPVTLSKTEWAQVLAPGDPVIAVHIPTGGPLEESECERSYAMAKEVFSRCFPEFRFKAFSCISWLMDRQLEGVSKPGAKIVTFLRRYIPYTRPAPGVGVFSFVFALPPYIDVNDFDYAILPEDSSLRQSMKQHYLAGGRIYEDGGIFFA